MNTLVLSILVILFIIVIFFSFKYFADLRKINAITNKNTEHFYFSESGNLPNTNLIVNMKTNLGFPLPLDSDPETINDADVLSNYYNAASHNSGNFTCYTKYLGLFRLVTLNQELQADPDADPMTLTGGSDSFTISFNDSLEYSFYGGGSSVPANIEKKECWGVKNSINTSNSNVTKYFDQLESYLSILDKPVEKPKINNFIIDNEDEILNFLNFGTKKFINAQGGSVSYINYYVKNARYLLTKDQQVTIVNNYLENRIYGTLESGLQFENYILRAVIGERNALNNGPNGFLYYLVSLFNNDLSTIQTTSAENNEYNLFDIIAHADSTEDTISITASNHNENIYKSLRYQLYVDSTIYYMEKLYARLALEASNNEAVIETILCPGDKCDSLTYEDFNEILINALNTDSETSRTTAAESSNIDLSVSIDTVELNLTYYYYIVILLLKLRTKIIKDNFMEKFNCKYMSFLFYSFRMGWKVFGDYINSVFSKYEAAILKDVFFELGDFEGLYKLFILSIKQGECNVFYEFETDKNMKKIGITLQRVLPDNNVEGDDLKLALDFNTRAFSFYHETGDIKSLCAGFNSAATCIPELTDSMCMWDSSGNSGNGECVPVPRLKTNCFEASGKAQSDCDSTECRWNSANKICKPNDCVDAGGDCETDRNHCEMKSNMAGDRRSSAVQAGIQDRCYDNLRVMYMTSSGTVSGANVQTSTTEDMNVPSFFFRGSTRRPLSHLDTCIQEVYNDSTNSYKPHQNAEERCSQSPNINCKYLNSTLSDTGNSHNNTEYRTCVSDELISPDSFYTCGTIKDERECDFNVKHNLDCFWQDGKCFNRDAPLHWRNPSGSKYGLEDSTNCNNFGSEFECPSNRCVWLGTGSKPCINKEDHPYYETATDATTPVPGSVQVAGIPLIKEKIDCEAVNHEHNLDNDKKRTECHALRCNYDHVNNICRSNVGNSCALRHNRESCIFNPLENYDPISEQNMCRWSENNNIELDTNTLGNGYCTDTRMLQPCGLFDASKCPTEEKRDTMGNIIENSNHCKIHVNLEDGSQSCVNNINSNFNGKETFNHCHYDYLNTGICNSANCRQLNLKNIDGSTVVNKCVPKERLPCSTLSMEECNNSNVVGIGKNKICEYNPSIERCEINETYESLIDKLQDATNRSDDDYYEINKMKDKLNNVDSLINENKQHYIKEEGLISGHITKIKKNGSGTNIVNKNKIVLKTNNTLINRLTKGDFISIKRVDNHTNIESSISEYEILDINLVEKEITINVDNISSITIDTTPRNPNSAIYWTMENPSKGLFGSYQHAQTIMDAIKINDFYNNFF